MSELRIASWDDVDLIKLSKQLASEALEKPQKYGKLLTTYAQRQVAAN